MKKSTKRVIARVMAMLMAFTMLPFDMWATANVVMAEELSVEADESMEAADVVAEETAVVEEETSSLLKSICPCQNNRHLLSTISLIDF